MSIETAPPPVAPEMTEKTTKVINNDVNNDSIKAAEGEPAKQGDHQDTANSTESSLGLTYVPPSKFLIKEELDEFHQYGIWFPEEVNTEKFTFADKLVNFGPHHLANINHPDLPYYNPASKTRIDTNIKFPQLYVLSMKWKISQQTGAPGSTKLILSFDNRDEVYKKPGSDENNFYEYLNKLDDKMRKVLFEKRKVWGLAYQNEKKAKDAYDEGTPLVSYGPVIAPDPANSNPYLDENNAEVDDYENYKGKMHRKYGPKFYATIGVKFHMEDTGLKHPDGKTKLVKVEEDEYLCEFLDGYTGEPIDLKPSNIVAWFEQEKKGLRAEGYYWQRFVQINAGKAPFIRNEARQICLWPASSRPSTESTVLPRGIGFSQAKVGQESKPNETEDNGGGVLVAKKEKEPSPPPAEQGAQIEEIHDEEEEEMPKTPNIVSSSHDQYMKSMKREAAKMTDPQVDDASTTETATPVKKKKKTSSSAASSSAQHHH